MFSYLWFLCMNELYGMTTALVGGVFHYNLRTLQAMPLSQSTHRETGRPRTRRRIYFATDESSFLSIRIA